MSEFLTRRHFLSSIKLNRLMGKVAASMGSEHRSYDRKAILEMRREELEKLSKMDIKTCSDCGEPFIPDNNDDICLPCQRRPEMERSFLSKISAIKKYKED